MKKHYATPAFDKIIFDVEDIITHSLATSEGDDVIEFDDWFTFTGDAIYFNGEEVK